MDIEELMKEQWQNAETTPPEEVWTQMRRRIQEKPSGNPQQSSGRSHLSRWLISAVSVAVVGAGIFAAVRMSQKSVSGLPETAGEEATVLAEVQQVPAETAVAVQDDEKTKPVSIKDDNSGYAVDKDNRTAACEERVMPREVNTDVVTPERGSLSQPIDRQEKEKNVGREERSVVRDTAKTSTRNAAVRQETIREQRTETQDLTAHRDEVQSQKNTQDIDREQRALIDKQLQIPNLISPNYDGYNDCWVLKGIETMGTVQVQIFTAQSQRVFSSNNYQNNFCGDDLPNGNYFFVIVIKEKHYSRRGVLVIQR